MPRIYSNTPAPPINLVERFHVGDRVVVSHPNSSYYRRTLTISRPMFPQRTPWSNRYEWGYSVAEINGYHPSDSVLELAPEQTLQVRISTPYQTLSPADAPREILVDEASVFDAGIWASLTSQLNSIPPSQYFDTTANTATGMEMLQNAAYRALLDNAQIQINPRAVMQAASGLPDYMFTEAPKKPAKPSKHPRFREFENRCKAIGGEK